MPSKYSTIMASFASGILKHFNGLQIPIPGEFILKTKSVRIVLKYEGRKISTEIPCQVIINASQHIEALQTMRYDIILELTQGLAKAEKQANSSNKSIVTTDLNQKRKKKNRRKRRRKSSKSGIVP